jgi:hypothetical protein
LDQGQRSVCGWPTTARGALAMCENDINAIFGLGQPDYNTNYYKELQPMCGTGKAEQQAIQGLGKALGGSNKQRFTYTPGSVVVIGGVEYVVINTDMRYMSTNGDPSKLYCSIRNERNGERWVVTRDKLLQLVDKPTPVYTLTPDQILEAGPCDEGLKFLVCMLKGDKDSYRGLSSYQMLREIVRSETFRRSGTIQQLFNCYLDFHGGATPPKDWLLFAAKVLKLVPEQSTGPDYDTLKRLLGIK